MGLFSKKNKDFSGSPTTDETSSYAGANRKNTLHKRDGTVPTTANGTTGPTNGMNEPTNGMNDPAIDGTGQFMGPGRTSEEQQYESPQQMNGGGRHSGSLGRSSGRTAGTTGMGATGAGVSTGGPTYGSRGTNMTNDDLGIARGKVHAAEAAEREALRMLAVARTAVKEAHEHVERLARDADEDARRAGLKQQEVHSLRQDTQHLGQSFN